MLLRWRHTAGVVCAFFLPRPISLHLFFSVTASARFLTALAFVSFDNIGPDSTCQHPSAKTSIGSAASKVFIHIMHTFSLSPSGLTLHSGSCCSPGNRPCRPPPQSPLIYCMSALREECRHINLICSPVG